MFLDTSIDNIGQIGAGKLRRTGHIDVAVIQSLYQKQAARDFVADYGQIIADECHHLSAVTFEKVMREAKARYVLGLTATPIRKDGHQPIIYMQCGPIRYRMPTRAMTDTTPFQHIVRPRATNLNVSSETLDLSIHDLYDLIVRDHDRNRLIAQDLICAVRSGRSPLLLTGRTEHLRVFAELLAGAIQNVFVLKGGLGRKQRREIYAGMAAVAEQEPRVILATGSYIGEGFDDARLDTLFLAMPISWKGTLQQYVGRLHRLHDQNRIYLSPDSTGVNG
jgi:superfamily II DNA or RNA helicase